MMRSIGGRGLSPAARDASYGTHWGLWLAAVLTGPAVGALLAWWEGRDRIAATLAALSAAILIIWLRR